MKKNSIYKPLIGHLLDAFGSRLKAVVLFGSRARKQSKEDSDHDIFLAIENLPDNQLERQKEIRKAIWDVPIRINTISKTPEEIERNLTPLMLEVCVDGICLYGNDYFEPYMEKALDALRNSGLTRKRVGREWYWHFDKIPRKEWELTWRGFHELS
ncbi:MAG: nucleotidyltransferase domain-containing protein [Candidatus Aminicenantes bacterium]|nr:nucleotidyltransferase domain-containing protein [Candidatus Aminicenantes bacterium]